MKSIAQMAKDLDISSSTIREYLSWFEDFFPDPVEHEGVKEYPPDAQDLIKKIYGYYQTSGMTKEEIRVKLEGPKAGPAATAAMSPMDMAQFQELGEKFERLIATIENLTSAITGANVETFKGIRKKAGSHEKLTALNDQITDIIESTRGEGENNENVEKNVLETDGTVIFSFGRLAPSAADAINFAKAHKKPWLHIDLETEKNPSKVLRKWLPQFQIKVLNVAGRSASKIPGL
ncbi:MAG: putative molybdenum carrier protein, partial [Proteobacteria bacterium]|nr:putative molybdenum carrier protein [Pseudomonadota bacterium]MBU1585632.1 putative molybdenum carrier protein [Pseudomonadota bacterium]